MTDREKAKRDYLSGKGLKEIALEFGIKDSTIRSWKRRDGWPTVQQKRATKKRSVAVPKKDRPTVEKGLTEKQQIFCELYVRNYNGVQSYMTVYGADYNTACAAASRMLTNDNIRSYIQSLKELKKQEVMADQTDVVEMYMKIAFANIGDYVIFGRRDVQVMGPFGPIYEKGPEDENEKVPITKTVNYVDIKESTSVDAGVIQEISQGKDGVKVKLSDRMKALEWLSKYFMMNPMDRHRVEYDNKKQKLDHMDFERRKKKDEEW